MNESSPMMALGKHWIVECYECDRDLLNDPKRLEELLRRVAEESGCTIVDSHFHAYQPQGVSGAVFILESHFTIHTWPEYRYAAVDGFGCGGSIDIDSAMRTLREGLGTEEVVLAGDLNRGIVSETGFTRASSISIRQIDGTLSWKEQFERRNASAMQIGVDLQDCDPDAIRDPKRLDRFVRVLIVRFGLGSASEAWAIHSKQAGARAHVGLCGLNSTANLAAPSGGESRSCFIDVLSETFSDPYEVGLFCKEELGAGSFTLSVNLRG